MPRRSFSKLPAEKQAKILEAAGREFAARGYEGASLNRVLRAAGFSKGAAYYYFDDKADLYLAVIQECWDRIMASAIPDFGKLTAENFWDELAATYRSMFTRCLERPWILDLARSVWKLSPEMRARGQLGRVFDLLRDWLGTVLEKGREVGAIRTDLPDGLVLRLLVAVDEAIGGWLVEHWGEFTDPERQALDIHLRALEMVRKMVGPEPARPG